MNWHNVVTFLAITSGVGLFTAWVEVGSYPTHTEKRVLLGFLIATAVFGALSAGMK